MNGVLLAAALDLYGRSIRGRADDRVFRIGVVARAVSRSDVVNGRF